MRPISAGNARALYTDAHENIDDDTKSADYA